MLFSQRRWNETNGECNVERNDDHIIQIPEDWDEIGDEVDRAESIRSDTGSNNLGVPWHAGIMGSKIQHQHIAFYGTCPLPQSLASSHSDHPPML
jgi:hypothetical protein